MEKKSYNKGGRPLKKASERRKYIIRSLMCTTDYFAVKAKAKACRKSLSTFMKEAALNASIKEPFTPEQMYLFRQLSGMANNLNQIAHKANAQGYTSAASECNSLATEIDNVIKNYKHDL